jgi:hypothetical protein
LQLNYTQFRLKKIVFYKNFLIFLLLSKINGKKKYKSAEIAGVLMKPTREFKYRPGVMRYDPMAFRSEELKSAECSPGYVSYHPYNPANHIGLCNMKIQGSSYQPYTASNADAAYRMKEKEVQTYSPLPVSAWTEGIHQTESEIQQSSLKPSILWYLSWKKRIIGWFETIFNILGWK